MYFIKSSPNYMSQLWFSHWYQITVNIVDIKYAILLIYLASTVSRLSSCQREDQSFPSLFFSGTRFWDNGLGSGFDKYITSQVGFRVATSNIAHVGISAKMGSKIWSIGDRA